MDTLATPPSPSTSSSWNPEDLDMWQREGARLGWRTLWVTTFCLLLAFSTWFMVSAIAVGLPGIGFQFDTQQLFWLTAMPGLAAGTLRIVHMFLIPILGTRTTVAASTLLLVIPCIGWGLAVQNPNTSFLTFLVLGFLAGLGGGNFSSFMPSTSLFFPKRLQGTALGYQAGIGNFGVSVAQFTVPWIIGFAMFGSLLGGSQTLVREGVSKEIWLQNAAYVWAPFCVLGALLAWIYLRSVPVKATFREQTDIFKNKHTWLMTSLYMMTFGSFSGYAAAFPLLIKQVYGGFPNAPDPLKYAFLGPLVGAGVRAAFGPISDKLGGARHDVERIRLAGVLALGDALHPSHFLGFLWDVRVGDARTVLLLRNRQRFDLQTDADDLPPASGGRRDRLDLSDRGLRPVHLLRTAPHNHRANGFAYGFLLRRGGVLRGQPRDQLVVLRKERV